MDFAETIALSAIMGLSIFISLPIVLHKDTGALRITLLTAIAAGILVFLVGDIFTDAAASLYNGSLYGVRALRHERRDIWNLLVVRVPRPLLR